jgi:UDP-N-acetyl-2-amino-2-deoxyglucuronate dehydrogenase
MNNKIKFAVIGLGNIGARHVQHILQNKDAELVALCDIDSNKYNAFDVPFFSSIEELLAITDADVVNICTPNYLHASHSVQCLKAQKHVVCEKPMSTSVADANQMIACANENNKTIFIVKQNRYNPPVQQVKKLLQTGMLGNIYFVNVNCFWNRNENYYNSSNWRGKKIEDGGCLYTQFSHFVDILYYLFGKVEAIKSLMQNSNHAYTEIEDNGTCILKTTEGALVNFNFSTCAFDTNMEGAITIIAENGTVKIGGQYLNTIEYQKIKNIELPAINISAKANDYGLYQGSMSNHDLVIQNVIDTINGTDTVMTNATEGRDVVQIIADMYAVVD